ncbi:hypothetical protein LCGC14_0111240 [marine sediment metagenome]|uniref:Uncharacterized protein n=2 Tax=root TaxID=1 RepID=A0A7V1BEV5_9RHOB|nr:hypothetical protein [Sulfitobacter litoralis]HDZ51568.1 hypothetical protein [Sulfitobacter litoralis]
MKNFARGQRGSVTSAAVLKEVSPRVELPGVAVWFSKAFPLGALGKHATPRQPNAIPGISVGIASTLEREVIWAVAILQSNAQKLRDYIELKGRIEEYLARGDFAEAQRILDNLTQNVCWSHGCLALKLFLISKIEGLESQKNWLVENILGRTNSPAAFFGYWLGVRQEPETDPQDFETNIVQSVPNLFTVNEDNAFLRHILMARAASPDEEANLVQQLQAQSIIDMYEGLVSQLIDCSARHRESKRHYLNHLVPLMEDIGDWRQKGVEYLLSGNIDSETLDGASGWSASRFIDRLRHASTDSSSGDPAAYAEALGASIDMTRADRENRAILGSFAYSDVWSDMCVFLRATYDLKSARTSDEIISLNRIRFLSDKCPSPYVTGYVQQAQIPSAYHKALERSTFEHDYFYLARAVCSDNYQDAKSLLRKIEQDQIQEDPELLRLEIVLALENQDWPHLTKRLTAATSDNSEILYWVPYSDISTAISDDIVEENSGTPDLAILLSRLAPLMGEQVRSQLVFAAELHLNNLGWDRPSEIPEATLSSDPVLQDFVLSCFAPETMALSLTYLDAEEMQEERLIHLALLANASEALRDRCEDESEQIIRSQEISKAMSTVAESKIDCDEDGLRIWAKEKLSSKYERFRSFVDAGILPASAEASRELLVAVREGDLGSKTFEIPSNEATSILREIINELTRAYSLDPYFGLNSYLSLRIRHGTVAGQLRRGCAEERLLTTADSDGDRYDINQHWFDILRENSPVGVAAAVAERLGDFSKSLDVLISNFSDNNLQILTDDKPHGLVATGFDDRILLGFFSDVISLKSMDDFLDAFSDLFWSNLEISLSKARAFIENDFRGAVMKLFDNLEAGVQTDANASSLPPISDAIVRARTMTNQSIDEVSQWFSASKSSESSVFSIPDLGRISLEIAKRLNPDFKPIVEFSGEDSWPIYYGLVTFTDVFGVLFDNVARHSGVQEPNVLISTDTSDSEVIKIQFASDCSDVDRALAAAQKANSKFLDGNYSSDLTAEGGTGLAKLSKIMRGSNSPQPFYVSVDERKKSFNVHLEFTYVTLGSG